MDETSLDSTEYNFLFQDLKQKKAVHRK